MSDEPQFITRPRLLDLFCGAGGAAMGYHRAGFDVTGVDIAPQPDYPFTFHPADAMAYPLDGYDAIHASPPCQDHSTLRSMHDRHGTGWMLAATIARLRTVGVPWVVENVAGAKSQLGGYWSVYCGSSFGLPVRRHRLFASSILLLTPSCDHRTQGTPLGVYGQGGRAERTHHNGTPVRGIKVGGAVAAAALGCDWTTKQASLTQMIPPAYTEHIGRQLIGALRAAA